MNTLRAKYADEIQAILAKYPPEHKRSAVMPLLYLAQREAGYVTAQAMAEIAEILDISITDVASVVGFYSLYYDQPHGRYHIQVCTDLPCALRGAEDFLKASVRRWVLRWAGDPGRTLYRGRGEVHWGVPPRAGLPGAGRWRDCLP